LVYLQQVLALSSPPPPQKKKSNGCISVHDGL
jgi:hypothetical protein